MGISPNYTSLNSVGAREAAVKISLARIASWFLIVAYAFGLEWVYRTYALGRYSYMGYKYVPNEVLVLFGMFLSVGLSILLSMRMRRPGDVFLWILFILVLVPAQVVPPVALTMERDRIATFQILIATAFLLIALGNHLPRKSIPVRYGSRSLFPFVLAAAAAGGYLVLFVSLPIPTSIPAFSEVYEVRFQHRDIMATAPPFVAYVWHWMAKVINPLIMAYGARNGRPSLIVLGFVGQLYLYAMNGTKSVVLSAGLVIVLIVTLRITRKYYGFILALGAGSLSVAASILDKLFNSEMFTALFLHRLVVLPGGILTGYYFEFFSDHEKARWASSFLGWLYEYPYSNTIPFVIGSHYYRNPETQANANLWADGFANFGVGGLLFSSILAAGVLWIFNCLSLGRDPYLIVVAAGFSAFQLSSASISVSLLTGGIGLYILLCFLMPYEKQLDERYKNALG